MLARTAILRKLIVVAVLGGCPAVVKTAAAADGVREPSSWRGVSSCSASACHGGDLPGGKGCEQKIWASLDKHSHAYEALFDKQSQTIVKNYYARAQREVRAECETLCIRCHVSPDAPQVPQKFRADGVSCESCHGPAKGWLTEHFRPAWKSLSAAKKEEKGFRQTKDLFARARLCADCHVGSADAEVNHDLLAAGHPRLAFDLSFFEATLPRHWSIQDERARYADFDYRLWAIGQATSAKAALDLLAHRAEDKSAPWPEFAETSCYKCHHELKDQSWRKAQPGERLGTLGLNSWYYAKLPDALLFPGSRAVDFASELKVLTEQMAKQSPSRQNVIAQAAKASELLRGYLGSFASRTMAPMDLAALLKRDRSSLTQDVTDWDHAAQDWLALAAIYRAANAFDSHFRDVELEDAFLERGCELRRNLRETGPIARRRTTRALLPR